MSSTQKDYTRYTMEMDYTPNFAAIFSNSANKTNGTASPNTTPQTSIDPQPRPSTEPIQQIHPTPAPPFHNYSLNQPILQQQPSTQATCNDNQRAPVSSPQPRHQTQRHQQQMTNPSPPQQQITNPSPPQQQITYPSPPQQQLTNPSPPQQQTTNPSPPQQQTTNPSPPQQHMTNPSPPQQQTTNPSPPQQHMTNPSPPQQQTSGPIQPQRPLISPAPAQRQMTSPIQPQHQLVTNSTQNQPQFTNQIAQPYQVQQQMTNSTQFQNHSANPVQFQRQVTNPSQPMANPILLQRQMTSPNQMNNTFYPQQQFSNSALQMTTPLQQRISPLLQQTSTNIPPSPQAPIHLLPQPPPPPLQSPSPQPSQAPHQTQYSMPPPFMQSCQPHVMYMRPQYVSASQIPMQQPPTTNLPPPSSQQLSYLLRDTPSLDNPLMPQQQTFYPSNTIRYVVPPQAGQIHPISQCRNKRPRSYTRIPVQPNRQQVQGACCINSNVLNHAQQQQPVLVSSTTLPPSSPLTQSVEVQVNPEMVNKGLQFDGTIKEVTHRALNATVDMVDAIVQTDREQYEKKPEKTFVDRASSPIIFPLPDVPVRRKTTAKRRKLNERSIEHSDSETEINVIE